MHTPDFVKGEYNTLFIEKNSRMLLRSNGNNEEIENIAMIASYIDYLMNLEENKSSQLPDGRPISRWREFGFAEGSITHLNKRKRNMEIHIGDRIADVTLVSKEGNKVQFLIDGKPYDVDIVMAENGSCSILHDGNSFNAELIRGEGGKSYDVNMFYRSYHVDIVDTQTKYLRMKKGGEEKQDDRIIAPMPGKVVKIPVQKGDRLSAGDIVVVLEAMKMQSNYKVSSDCVVKDILVQEGDAVNANQELIILDIIKED